MPKAFPDSGVGGGGGTGDGEGERDADADADADADEDVEWVYDALAEHPASRSSLLLDVVYGKQRSPGSATECGFCGDVLSERHR